jgi:transposase
MNVAGIDVAHKTLGVVLSVDEKAGKAQEFANTASGHQALVKALTAARVERVCLEATGSYHLDLALALDAAGLALMVVNPKAAKRFAEALLTRAKTEAKNQLHALTQSQTTPTVVLADVRLIITQCEGQIKDLHTWAEGLIQADTHLKEVFALLTTVKGIASASAIQLMGEILVLPADMRAKQWVALAGLDPRQYLAGTSVHTKPRLSKAGNRYLRLALFMPALSAARHDRHVNGYYHHLIEDRGLKKIQAVCAVMRKLLHAIHGMLKSRQPFDGRRF